MQLLKYLGDFVNTIYPSLCILCWENQPVNDDMFCVSCSYHLPLTDHFEESNNALTEKFRGRVQIVHAAALLNFHKESNIRLMLHRLKYDGKKRIGVKLGQLAAKKLLTSSTFEIPDIIIPVPLHYKKQKLRGYNQSTTFAQGFSEVSGIPFTEKLLLKVFNTPSQTAKSRTDRLLNVEDAFIVKNENALLGKHILLVDDIVTTGATLESCANVLQKIAGIRISILAIAVAKTTMIG